MNNYTNNGIANLASYGRGNDTELVHMTPGEVKGLQALAMAHGGSLTINPDTGLVEAGFLEQILPVVAAAGLTYLTAGAATPLLTGALGATGAGIVAGAGAGAVISGSMAAIQGKDVGQAALMGGLGGAVAGGMGAYGDANVFGVGAAEGAGASTQAGSQLATVPPGAVTEGAAASIPADQIAVQQTRDLAAQQAASQADPARALVAEPPGAVIDSQAAQATSGMRINPETGDAYTQLTSPTSPTTAAPSYYSGLKPDQYIQKAAIQSLPALSLLEEKQQNSPGGEEDEYTRRLKGYKLSSDYKAYEAPRPDPYYRPSYAAEGGVMNSYDDENGVDMASGGIARYRSKGQVNVLQDYLDRQDREETQKQKHLSTSPSSYFPDVGIFRDSDVDTARKDALTASMIRLGKAGKTAGIKAIPLPKTSIKGLGDVSGATPEIEEAADGGVMGYNLGGYSDGGRMLEGPGDGMSDSIPASIAGKQPARLADGEFVVPADVVSHLGNGSTDAGAKKLYDMMDKIRMARTGTKKQAPEVDVDKYLPTKKASGGIAGYAEGGTVGYAEGGVARYNTGGVSYNAQLAANVQAAYDQGYSGAQIGAALIASGVSPETAAAATGLSSSVISQAYAGGADLTAGGKGIGNAAGNPGNPNPAPAPYTPGVVAQALVTPATPAPVNKNTTGPGGYTIPTFSDVTVAGYLRDNNITSKAQIDQVSAIFNVNADQIARAQALIAANDPRIAEGTAQYIKDIAANPAQVAQNERDVRARMEQLGLTGPIIPPLIPVTPPTTPTTPTTPLTPQEEDLSRLGTQPYRPGFVPRSTGMNKSTEVLDPYSNKGLTDLYGQMMGQYEKAPPPILDADVRDIVRQYIGNGAEVGRQLINRGIPMNQAISALRGYPELTPDIINQAYLGGQALGGRPPPTLDTQYTYSDPGTYYRPPAVNNLTFNNPIRDASRPAAAVEAAPAPAADAVANKTGGLLSIDRKKLAKTRAKTKPKRGLMAA